MKTGRFAGGRLVGGFVVLAIVGAFLVVASVVSMDASPTDFKVQPAPVPTPPTVRAIADEEVAGMVARAPATVAPSPKPVPTPPDSPLAPQGQTNWATVALILGLSAFATLGLFLLRLAVSMPAGSTVPGMHQAPTACQEC